MRRLIQVAASITCAALVAGCGGAPEASAPPSPARATPSPSLADPDPVPSPTLSTDLQQRNQQGVQAGVRAFVDALNYGGEALDTDPLRRTFVDQCTRCEAIADSIDQTAKDGGSFSGGTWEVARLEFYGIQGEIAYVDALIDYGPQEWIATADSEPVEYDGASNELHAFQLLWTPQGWRVGALDPEA